MSVSDTIKSDAKVLIISWSPIPTPKYQKIEGSGQRFFGLATGLQKNGISDITIAVGHIYPLDVSEVSGIKLVNYDFNSDFVDVLSGYDTIIFNYTIHGSAFIAEHLPQRAQVIIDAYGPAYIENLARDPKDMLGTYVGNLAAVRDVFNKVLPRADYVLFANDAQEKLYTGVLTTLGVINQFSYKTERLLRVPFGIDKPDHSITYENPYVEFGIKKDDFVLLWFGGLYPWFDITGVLDIIKEDTNKKVKFVIVGGNNPQNQHPDFVRNYQNTVQYVVDNKLEDRVILIDWVDYATRRKYYQYANAIISINNIGKESVYSWRTRVMDYVGNVTPLITNGGDPLSDELVRAGAAFKINDQDKQNTKAVIEDLATHSEKLKNASDKLRSIQPKYYWETVTKPLAQKIQEQSKPYTDERIFRLENNITSDTPMRHDTSSPKRSYRMLASKVVRKTREKGIRTTYTIVRDKVRHRAGIEYRKRFSTNEEARPRVVVVSNQLNNTGGPFVIIDLLKQGVKKYPSLARRIKLVTFTPIEAGNVLSVEKSGIDVEVHTNRNLHLDFNMGDIVILNTFAVSRTTIFSVVHAINQGRVTNVFWYGHEASPEGFIDPDVRKFFAEYLERGIAKIYAVSEATKKEYVAFFGTSKNIEKMPFRFLFDEEKFAVRKKNDFEKLNFISTGSLMDMRKGQYPILYAFLDFYHNHYIKTPDTYRDFHIEFIGAYDKTDLSGSAAYHVKNIYKQFMLSSEGLKNHCNVTESLSHKNAVEKICAANVTICYSLYEALPIFVYEGMASGHPIIRNDSPGKQEQLSEGEEKNGLAVYSNDFASLVDAIETLLNKQKTSSKELVAMSEQSNRLAIGATKNTYQLIDEIGELTKDW